MPTAHSNTSLSAIAKAITNFLFGELPLPTSLSHYATFFTGLVTGAMGATALFTYVHRNKRDRAKIQLAVYHIIHIFQQHPDHQELLQRPQELLRHMEPEVLRMVDKHLTINEAEEVTKVLKRTCEANEVEECAQKRVRENECVVSEQMVSDSIAARPQSQRGFLPEFGPDWIERPQEFKLTPVRSETQPFSPLNTREPWSDFSTQEDDGLDDYNQPTSDQKQLQFECGQYDDDMMNLDDSSHITDPNTTMTPCPHDHRSSAPSPESTPTFMGSASTPIPAPKDDGYAPDDEFDAADELDGLATPLAEASKMSTQAIGKQSMESPQQHRREGYGLSYDDADLYSSSTSEEESVSAPTRPPDEYIPPNWINEQLLKSPATPSESYVTDTPLLKPKAASTRPPTVIAMVRGVKGRGASLSPIAEGSSDSPRSMVDRAIGQERLDAALAQEEIVPHLVPHTQAQTTTTQSEETLPFAHWTTTPGITYSSSSSSKSETLTEPETETVPNPIILESLSSPPKKRKSSSLSSSPSLSQEQGQEETSTTFPPPKRRRTSPLRDITTSHAGTPTPSPPTSLQKRTPTPPQPSPSPRPRPRRRSHRRRSREDTRSPAAAAAATPTTPSPHPTTTAQTPGTVTGTRKSGRSKAFGGVYTA